MHKFDDDNVQFKQAASFVNHTKQNLFLTGKAGTGKTTFLKYIKETTPKKMAVIAPTGVAAINAGGTTIHSFFQLPFGTFIPGSAVTFNGQNINTYNEQSLFRNLKLRKKQRDIIRSLELLIIDEISMVRADLLDAIDTTLRGVRKKNIPFGGVQLLLIGDMYQLPPVIRETEWSLMASHYNSPFFFDANAMKEQPLVYIELKKIYRQKNDHRFIEILQNVRNNTCTSQDFEILNQKYKPNFSTEFHEGYITLTTHNRKADEINKKELQKLPGNLHRMEATVNKQFPESAFPVDKILELKEGAQIMFIKNDKGDDRKYYNGKIGKIKKIKRIAGVIEVEFKNEPDTIEVELETWKNIRYEYNTEKDQIVEEELGSFEQFPIRLAWAVTVHKSQGLTFDKAIVDVGQAFAAGQVYVALSRLTNLDGLVLHSQIKDYNIKVDPRIVNFSKIEIPEDKIDKILEHSQKEYAHNLLIKAFDFEDFTESFRDHAGSYGHKLIPNKAEAFDWAQSLLSPIMELKESSQKYIRFLNGCFHINPIDYTIILKKNKGAINWFSNILRHNIIAQLRNQIEKQKGRERVKSYVKELSELKITAERKFAEIERTKIIAEALTSDSNMQDILNKMTAIPISHDLKVKEEKKKKEIKGSSASLSLQLFKEGKSISEIAKKRELTEATIFGHLINFIKSDNLDIGHFVSPQNRILISAIIDENPEANSGELRAILGDEFSFQEIKAVMKFLEKEQVEEL